MGRGVAEDRSGKDIRGMVGLQGDARETHGRGKTVNNPGAPARPRITVRGSTPNPLGGRCELVTGTFPPSQESVAKLVEEQFRLL